MGHLSPRHGYVRISTVVFSHTTTEFGSISHLKPFDRMINWWKKDEPCVKQRLWFGYTRYILIDLPIDRWFSPLYDDITCFCYVPVLIFPSSLSLDSTVVDTAWRLKWNFLNSGKFWWNLIKVQKEEQNFLGFVWHIYSGPLSNRGYFTELKPHLIFCCIWPNCEMLP